MYYGDILSTFRQYYDKDESDLDRNLLVFKFSNKWGAVVLCDDDKYTVQPIIFSEDSGRFVLFLSNSGRGSRCISKQEDVIFWLYEVKHIAKRPNNLILLEA